MMNNDRVSNILDEFAGFNTGDDLPTPDEWEEEDMDDLRRELSQIGIVTEVLAAEEFR